MFPIHELLLDMAIFIAVFTVFVLGTLLWKPRIWLHDFPADIQALAAPKTDAEKRLGPVVDAGVADTLITRTKWPLVDRVEESLLSRAGLKPLGAPIRTAPSEARR